MAALDPTLEIAPEPGWNERCLVSNSLFHSSGWQDVLSTGLGCTSLYACRADGTAFETVLNVFRAGPFRVAYAAYPVGGTIRGTAIDANALACMSRHRSPVQFDLLRLPASGFAEQAHALRRAAAVPETAIVNLPSWRETALPPAVRRNLGRAASSGLEIRATTSEDIAPALYAMYSATIRRHDGQLRYKPEYFAALLSLSSDEARIRVLAARLGKEITAFIVVALHGTAAYYLHGGMDLRFSSSRPSDALFAAAISWAQAEGAQCFNMMSSPPSQPSLVSFKEKWGGITRAHRTFEIPVRPLRAALFHVAERATRLLR